MISRKVASHTGSAASQTQCLQNGPA